MRFQLKNVGVISEADMLLDNITLIAAENDSGKSTIGKALFTLINTMNYFEDEYISTVNKMLEVTHYGLVKLIEQEEEIYSKKIIKNIKKNKLSTKIYKYYFVQIVYNIVTLKGIFREES